MLLRLWGRIVPTPVGGRTPNRVRSSGGRAEPSPHVHMDCQRAHALRCTRTSSVKTHRATRTIPTPDGASLRDIFKGRAVAPPLSRAANQTTVGVLCSDLGSSFDSIGSKPRCSSSRVEPTMLSVDIPPRLNEWSPPNSAL